MRQYTNADDMLSKLKSSAKSPLVIAGNTNCGEGSVKLTSSLR